MQGVERAVALLQLPHEQCNLALEGLHPCVCHCSVLAASEPHPRVHRRLAVTATTTPALHGYHTLLPQSNKLRFTTNPCAGHGEGRKVCGLGKSLGRISPSPLTI